MPVKASYLLLTAAGGIVAWSGIKGKGVSSVFKEVLSGQKPSSATGTNSITPAVYSTAGVTNPLLQQELATGKLPAGGNASVNKALAQSMAIAFGWGSGQNWQALNYGWGTLESGWNQYATNPGSGAFGIAQALGHGNANTAGKYGNEYGPVAGMNLPNSVYVSANNGNASAQILWGLTYIKITYGQPANVPGWLGQGGYNGY